MDPANAYYFNGKTTWSKVLCVDNKSALELMKNPVFHVMGEANILIHDFILYGSVSKEVIS